MAIVSLQYNHDPESRFGEGISRTSEKRSRLFELKIWMPGQGAMRDLIRATSINEAVAFARNRYPKCEIEVPEEAVKPKLARSQSSAREKAKRRSRIIEAKSEQSAS